MKFIDFFAGIGGFRTGMTSVGHEVVGWCEKDKNAQKSYRSMYNIDREWFASDIRKVKSNELPEAEIYTGGFPCQSFSVAGYHGGFKDTRGTLIFEILRLARKRKPKYLFLENVRGLLSNNGGKTFGTILNSLDEMGYDAEWQLIDSKHWLPERRNRVYIIGHNREKPTRKVFPIRTLPDRKYKLGVDIVNRRYGEWYVRKENNITNLDKHYNSFPDNHGARAGVIQNGKIRKLTPKECFKFQGFIEEQYKKARKVNNDTELYKQIGNSVAIPVIKEIGKRLKE